MVLACTDPANLPVWQGTLVQGGADGITCPVGQRIAIGESVHVTTNEGDDPCYEANNFPCDNGAVSCVPEVCDTVGTDVQSVWAYCVEEHSPLLALEVVGARSEGGDAYARCPDDHYAAFGWTAQNSTNHSSEACLKSNHHDCRWGDPSCVSDICETGGLDVATTWLACYQPEPQLDSDGDGVTNDVDPCPFDDADLCVFDHYEDLEIVNVVGDAGDFSASCSEGRQIAFGWTAQSSTEHNDEGCLKTNNGNCTQGLTTCSTVACDTTGDDESRIFMACVEPDDLPTWQGTAVFETGDEGDAVADCPANMEIAFGFSTQTSTGHSSDACMKANNGLCPAGATQCAQAACDTSGNDEGRIWMLCTDPSSDLRMLVPTSDVGDAGEASASCTEEGDGVAFGWGVQESTSHSSTSCIKANNRACHWGLEACGQARCDTAGNDEAMVYAACFPR